MTRRIDFENVKARVPRELVERVRDTFPHWFGEKSIQRALEAALGAASLATWCETLIRICARVREAGHLERHEVELLAAVEKDLRQRAIGTAAQGRPSR